MTVVSGLNCNIYNLSVNHVILYCSCRHKRSSLDLKQFRVSLMINILREGVPISYNSLAEEGTSNIEPKAFLVDLLAVAPGPSITG